MISEQTLVIPLTGVAFANSLQDTDKWPKLNKTTVHTMWQLSASDNFRTYELWEDSFTIHIHDFPTQYSPPIHLYSGSTQRSRCRTN